MCSPYNYSISLTFEGTLDLKKCLLQRLVFWFRVRVQHSGKAVNSPIDHVYSSILSEE